MYLRRRSRLVRDPFHLKRESVLHPLQSTERSCYPSRHDTEAKELPDHNLFDQEKDRRETLRPEVRTSGNAAKNVECQLITQKIRHVE